MKFIHIADMHFDAPFRNLYENGFGEERRLEQRKVLKNIIEYIKKEAIPYFFICGDFYEQEYVRKSTIQYINDLFEMIPDTKIYIVPGNHDPYLKNSYYAKFPWSPNVKIFTSEVEKIEEEEFDLYGYGFSDFAMEQSKWAEITIENPNKINILLTHSSIDGNGLEAKYNPLKKTELQESEFDYIGLGHIHKPLYQKEETRKVVYPGSTIAQGFDELGKHGAILGEVEKGNLELTFLPFDEKEFVVQNFEMEKIDSQERLIEALNELTLDENKYYEITLVGTRNFEVRPYEIQKQLDQVQILKIKDKTKMKQDLDRIAKENSLRGIFVAKMLEKIEENPDQKEKIEKAIEIGLESM